MSSTAVRKEDIVKLREKTGAGFMECKGALQEGGSLDKALVILRKKGVQLAKKKSGRAVREGLVQAYIHSGNRVGVLVEIGCETDFVARNAEFQNFVKDVAMQVAAASPRYVSREEISQEVIDKEREIFRAQIKGKPEHVVEKILDGKLSSFYKDACLLEQPFIKKPDTTIQAYLTEVVAKIGENIVIRRFTRYELGEETK